MNTTTSRNIMTLSALIVSLLMSSVASAAAPSAVQSNVPTKTNNALASYIFVCRDAHHNLDRRACHHMGRLDPQRVTIAMR